MTRLVVNDGWHVTTGLDYVLKILTPFMYNNEFGRACVITYREKEES